jgi:hypothetical protein
MGPITLVKQPPEGAVDHTNLILLFQKNVFEDCLDGINAYVALKFVEAVFDLHFEARGPDLWPMDGFELEDLFAGKACLEYWQNQASNMNDMMTMRGAPTTVLKAHSLIAPLALAENRPVDAIKSAFFVQYLCSGGDIAPLTGQADAFESKDRDIYLETLAILREHLIYALAHPEKVIEAKFAKSHGDTSYDGS